MTDTRDTEVVSVATGDEPYLLPASFAQERLWFFTQLVPDLGVYNLGCPFELAELGDRADPDAFEAALADVVERHETLRTSLSMRGDELVQVVHRGVPVTVVRTDLRELPPDQRATMEEQLATEDSALPIPLESAPLWRARLIQRADDDWSLVFVVHHAVFDAQSVRNLARDLMACYRARLAGHRADLPELPIQYADFAAWQRDRLAGGELADQLAYWQRALADLPSPLRLPASPTVSDSVGRHDGADVSFGLPGELGQAVRDVARANSTTPFTVLLTGFVALLSRLTGQQDIIVGSPVSGRVLPELAGLIGMFVNTLVLRVNCAGGPSFTELLGRVRTAVLDALDNQEVPYDRLVENLAPDRDADGMPLHQVVFNLLPLATNTQIRNGTAKADLLLDLAEDGDGYDGRLEYRANLLADADAAAFGTRLARLLAAGLAAPDVPVSRLPILAAPERQAVLAGAGVPSTDEPVLVTDLFAAHVAATPHAIAVRDAAGHELTYAELDQRSAQLAGHLQHNVGLGPDSIVAILLDTGLDLAVAVLAVLRCGAGYLPLDLRHPADRMRYLLADADAVAVLSHSSVAGKLPAGGPLLINVDTVSAHTPVADARPKPDALAYVIYTSGSTGEPKGVGVSHGNLAAYVAEVHALLRPGPGRVFSMLQTLTFDFSLTMFYGALTSGGTLCLVPRDFAADAYWVTEHLSRDRVDYLKITPSHLRALQAGGTSPTALLPRQALLLGGEAAQWPWVSELRALGDCAVFNHYGPTETTVGALAFPGDREPAVVRPGFPLGWPLAHATSHVLDDAMELVPDGVPGELFIGGATVSRGYLGRPALTAGRFLPDPFGPPGARLYRTGDRARRLPDGSVEFLGRVDDQVKVRGYRVELGEVRHVLSTGPDVADCFVTLAESGGEPQLVAYVAPSDVDLPALRAFADERLPEFMVPSVFVPLAELPLTAHGKVDRSRLPDPTGEPSDTGPAQAPQDAVEDLVASIFERLLDRQHVGRTDSFFGLGGHSLLAIQMVTRLRSAFGVGIPLRGVFEDPTVAGIANRVRDKQRNRGRQLPPVAVLPRDEPLPVSYGQRRLWFLDQLESAGPLYHTNVCLRLRGELDAELLREAMTGVVARHEVLRTRFVMTDGELTQVVDSEAAVPWRTTTDETALRDSAERPFDLATAPPLRVLLVRLADQEHLLLITLHHLVNDAWSANLLVRELGELYRALRTGTASTLPELTVQYADYAAWQRQLVDTDLRDSQLAYWRDRLAGSPAALALPTDRPRPVRQGYDGAHAGFRLPAAIVDRLRAVGADENASLFMVLLTGFLVLLGRHTGQRDLLVGTPASNRNRPEFEPLLGFFLNTLVLRTDTSGEPTFRELLRRVRTTALEAFANQDVPFEALVEELAPRRDLGGTPLVQAMFTLEDAERETVATDGLTLSWEPYGTDTAKFDVQLYLWRRPDGVSGAVEYRTDLFDAGTMARFAEHYTALLGAAAADPDRVADRLPMLTGPETALLARFNDTDTLWPGPATVPAMLAEQVAATPGGAALVWSAGQLTYAEFGAAVHRLARLLVARGVRPGDVVGVLARRGPELVTAVHAITAAGAAYLPLDPDNPVRRLAFLRADAGARLVLTTSAVRDRLDDDVPMVVLDEVAGELAGLSPEPVRIRVAPESTAYVLYTSGSTGQPKGAAVAHRALVNRLRWMQDMMPIGPADPVLHKTPFGFDVSVWELCWPLVTGATMVIAEPNGHRDTRYLANVLAAQRISTVHFVPSMLAAFLAEPGLELPDLRTVVCSGEALTGELADRCQALLPNATLFNLYGPTEAAIDVTAHRCRPGEEPVPIGAPVANTRIHIVDEHGERSAVGVPGEICLAGVQLADGYPARPGLTADRFVPDPFGPPGSRMYRTGDLGRWAADGEIVYLGRLDHQIKVRGMRVEPGEIEAALVAEPGIRAAAVLPSTAHDGATVLTAYLVGTDEPPTAAELKARLAGTLPAHMVPSGYRFLPELPVTGNGKLDRAALPAPDEPVGSDQPFQPPTGARELAVAEVWAGVLGVRRIGALDDFFALGGDSIRALKVVARLRAAGYLAELPALFEQPTPRGLAGTLTSHDPVADQVIEPFSLVEPAVAERARSREGVVDAYPLAALQAGMLFHSEFTQAGSTYHDVFTLRVSGTEYRADALADAVADVVARHAILRTSLHVAEFDEPVQLVHAAVTLPVVAADLRGVDDAEAALADFENTERRQDFDLAAAPLLRLFVHRLSDTEFALTLSFHHAILDGWSVATLTTELLDRYTAHVDGTPKPVNRLPIAYRDFVAAERAVVAGPAADFWRDTLADAPGTEIPRRAGHLRGVGTGDAAVRRTELDAELVTSLEAVARLAQVPLRTVCFAAHLRVLGLLAGQPDVISGVVTHGRPAHDAGADVLGLFLNTMAIRVSVDRPSWTELIRSVYAAELAALPHRTFPLLEVQRVTGRSPVYDALFDYRDFHVYGDLPDDERLRITGYSFFEQTNVPFAANLIRSPGTGTLALQLKYDSDQFDADQVADIEELYLLAFASVAGDPASDPRDSAPYLASAAARIERWNATEREYPAGSVPELVAAQAAATPDAVALLAGDTTLAYAELATRIARLARHLRTVGVRAGDVVGVCLHRSVDLVVAVHAVQAAGAAYLPLEPDHPPTRLAGMADDADATVVITTADLTDRVPGRQLVLLDADAARVAEQDATPLAGGVLSDSLAYVIFTSGSTGRPKGVGVSHRAIANRLRWMQESYRIGADDRVLHKTPFGFDVSVWELCWPLITGATMVIAEPDGHRDSTYLVELIERRGITVAHFVPSMLDALLEEPDLGGRLTGLRQVVCSGEALSAELAGRLIAVAPNVALHNLYGPTEAAVDVTQHTYVPGAPTVPIGRPVANTRIEVLDERGERVPVEAPGELCIGGVQVAVGYRNRPALTADRFRPDRHGAPGARLYRTGDLARWLPDGEIEYLGRLDRQVKIRGFRIELGEIEAQLAALPDVRSVAVLARPTADGGRRLVAYLVGTEHDPVELLRDRLPDHMVPTTYVWLDEFPLTHNGKLDRSALPEPDARHTGTYQPPNGAVEHAVAKVWSEVLGVPDIGALDDFFALGGDSIRSLKVIARLRRLGYQLAIGELFSHPNIRALAATLTQAAEPTPAPAPASAFALVNPQDLALLTQRFGDGRL
ncbi:MAG TPA: amino acid adenylation domain-containing protein [Pseudonocardiaceae bacterium]|nr:amino acid adenylation domain-containing protein [Pseudonocardiaceae bacterium]